MTNKESIIKAGRLNDIRNILCDIISETDRSSYPVDAFVDTDGQTKWRVDGESVRLEAREVLFQLLETNEIKGRFDDLHQYLLSWVNMELHNYSIAISHRHDPSDGYTPTVDMEKIRSLLIIENCLCCLNLDPEESGEWSIPNGWKKLEGGN